ncbi:MAG: hypothetical protein OK454_10610 [Thaumarchaeota archaeon]|nr:hypothetical protein [Nitrososphaerota archaeon]
MSSSEALPSLRRVPRLVMVESQAPFDEADLVDLLDELAEEYEWFDSISDKDQSVEPRAMVRDVLGAIPAVAALRQALADHPASSLPASSERPGDIGNVRLPLRVVRSSTLGPIRDPLSLRRTMPADDEPRPA